MEDDVLGLRVVRVLIDHGCEPGADYADALAQTWFTEAGLDDQECELGLVTARDKGWLVVPPDRPGIFQLTQAGFDSATISG